MTPLAYLAATWLGLTTRIAAALAAAYRRHNRHLTERADFDRHVGEALAVVEETPLYDATAANQARIDAAVTCFAAEVEALADSELQELIEGDRP